MRNAEKLRPPVSWEAGATNNEPEAPRIAQTDDVEQLLSAIRRFESAARTIADDDVLTVRARCRGLLDLMARARTRDGGAFLEVAVWKGCAHFFEDDDRVPRTVIEAGHRLIRQGHSTCPECKRPVPSLADLDHWRQVGHEMHTTRRSA